jgi:hypothetical protein
MISSVVDEQNRQSRTEQGIGDAEIDRHWPQAVASCKIASEKGGDADGEIAGKLIQADGKTARFGPDEIDLHDDGHRPGKPLIDAEQGVGGDDPAPAGRPHDHERNREPEEPTEDENTLAAPDIGELPGDQVGKRLDDSEADDERHHEGGGRDAELFRTDQRHDRALDADHTADKGIDEYQQRELSPIGTQAEADGAGVKGISHGTPNGGG